MLKNLHFEYDQSKAEAETHFADLLPGKKIEDIQNIMNKLSQDAIFQMRTVDIPVDTATNKPLSAKFVGQVVSQSSGKPLYKVKFNLYPEKKQFS